MTNVFIIHGAYGHPKENWFPWLKEKLEDKGCQVFVPEFPTLENQTLDNWLNIFKDYESHLSEDSIVVGHSLGPAFLLNVLEQREKPIKAAFFVAGFTGLLGIPKFDKINKTFTDKTFNWEKVKQNCKKFYIINSDNDPYVPIEKGEELAKSLGSEVKIIKNAGHFGSSAGFDSFNLLLSKITSVI